MRSRYDSSTGGTAAADGVEQQQEDAAAEQRRRADYLRAAFGETLRQPFAQLSQLVAIDQNEHGGKYNAREPLA